MPKPPVRVSPGRENATHHISLGDGTDKIGLIFLDDLRQNVLQEIPISEPPHPYTVRQRNWFGGTRRYNAKDDPNGFFDSYAMWVSTEGHLFPRPIEHFAQGYRDSDASEPGNLDFQPLIGSYIWLAKSFVPDTSYTLRHIGLWLRFNGEPGDLTIQLYSNSAGSPNVSLNSVTLAFGSANVYGWHYVTFSAGTAVTAGTTYWIVVQASTGDNQSNHWLLGHDPAGSGKSSTNGTSWTATAKALYYRATDAETGMQWFQFNFRGAEYAVNRPNAGGTSTLLINGDRGKATSATASTLTDTGSGTRAAGGWTANMWAGARVRIIDGTGDGQIRSIVSNTTTALTVTPDWDVTPSATSQYIIYDTPIWQPIGTTGLTLVYSAPAVAGNIVYFPQGGTAIRKMQLDYTATTCHAFADDGTNVANLIEVFSDKDVGTQLWAALVNSARLKYGTPAAWGVATTFTDISGSTVGASDRNITALIGRDALYVFKEDSLWRMVKNRPVQLVSGMEYSPSPFNGLAAVGGNDQLWWGWNHSIVRMVGSDIRDMLNNRQGWFGLPPGRTGVPWCGINAGAWWFFGINGTTNNTSTVLMWNGQGWSEFYRAWAINKHIRNIYWMSTPEGRPKLYINVGGDLVYIEMPQFASNPQLDTTIQYQPFAELVTTVFDGGDATLEKVLHSARILATNISSSGGAVTRVGTIKVYTQVDSEIAPDARSNKIWHYIGEYIGGSNPRVIKADNFDIDFGRVNRYRLRLEIYTTTATDPLDILSVETDGDIYTPLQYRWVASFKVDHNQITLDGDPDFAPDDVLEFLQLAYERGSALQMRSVIPQMDDRTVVVANAPIVTRTYVRAQDGKAIWGGYITVGLKDPG